ncbi:hypothetical protein BKA80DRAFT_285053 [Phyllosticta citrichinensis]
MSRLCHPCNWGSSSFSSSLVAVKEAGAASAQLTFYACPALVSPNPISMSERHRWEVGELYTTLEAAIPAPPAEKGADGELQTWQCCRRRADSIACMQVCLLRNTTRPTWEPLPCVKPKGTLPLPHKPTRTPYKTPRVPPPLPPS